MPSTATTTKIQTSKQAKAAYKARGQSSVSPSERRRLERGAELLRRAENAKKRERQRKEFIKKKETEELQQKNEEKDVHLGTQLKLDRFGHKSSQFHLGNFLKGARKSDQSTVQSIAWEPWDDDELDEDDLIGNDRLDTGLYKASKEVPRATEVFDAQLNPLDAIDDMLLSSSQSIHALPNEITTSSQHKQCAQAQHFPSFTSEDLGPPLTPDELEELDRAVELGKQGPAKTQTAMMPPPAPSARQRLSSMTVLGISPADLEMLANEEIQLTQYNGT